MCSSKQWTSRARWRSWCPHRNTEVDHGRYKGENNGVLWHDVKVFERDISSAGGQQVGGVQWYCEILFYALRCRLHYRGCDAYPEILAKIRRQHERFLVFVVVWLFISSENEEDRCCISITKITANLFTSYNEVMRLCFVFWIQLLYASYKKAKLSIDVF